MATYEQCAKIALKLIELRGEVPDEVLARTIGNKIYDVPTKFGDYAERCFVDLEGYLLPNAMRPDKICEDHRVNRQYGGMMIITMEDPTLEKILDLIENVLCVVNYVKPSTNTKLSQIQKKHAGLPWQEQYAIGEVDYVYVKGKRGTFVYIIDGVYYGNKKEVEKAFDISGDEVSRRCEIKKFPTWKAVRYEDYIMKG